MSGNFAIVVFVVLVVTVVIVAIVAIVAIVTIVVIVVIVTTALQCSRRWLSEWVTRSPIELSWTAKKVLNES